jgi:hypothetical protein
MCDPTPATRLQHACNTPAQRIHTRIHTPQAARARAAHRMWGWTVLSHLPILKRQRAALTSLHLSAAAARQRLRVLRAWHARTRFKTRLFRFAASASAQVCGVCAHSSMRTHIVRELASRRAASASLPLPARRYAEYAHTRIGVCAHTYSARTRANSLQDAALFAYLLAAVCWRS